MGRRTMPDRIDIILFVPCLGKHLVSQGKARRHWVAVVIGEADSHTDLPQRKKKDLIHTRTQRISSNTDLEIPDASTDNNESVHAISRMSP